MEEIKQWTLFGWKLPWGKTRDNPDTTSKDLVAPPKNNVRVLPHGRVSVPNDETTLEYLKRYSESFHLPSFRSELIPLIRDLYKVNPDMGIAVQDMYKLTNSGHYILFPNNTPEEGRILRKHLEDVSKNWMPHTAGVNGINNRLIVQGLVGGAISVESVPKRDLSGISNLVLINPEDIIFKRLRNGIYEPYQKNRSWLTGKKKESHIKLNPLTYTYLGLYNDTDEPNGIPPFLTALDSLKQQSEMKTNINQIMEIMGLMGFVEALMEKPEQRGNESEEAYASRLVGILKELKSQVREGLMDGVVAGFVDDHEIKLNPTTKDVGNVPSIYNMNQQSLANGLGVNGSIIGVNSDNKTEGGTSIMFSKMLSQLKNIHFFLSTFWEKVYLLELQLAPGLPRCKGIKVNFNNSTITDDLKVQQSKEIKIRNLNALYDQGIIGQDEYAREMGIDNPDQKEPRVSRDTNTSDQTVKDEKREKDKDTSDRRSREKDKTTPKRKDGQTKPV